MSGFTLDLAKIQALITLGGYGGTREISTSSAVVALCGALGLDNLSNWQGVGDTLTDAEIDDIQELVATLEYEIMTGLSMPTNDRVKLTISTPFDVVKSTTTEFLWDSEVYDPTGMHSLIAQTGKINILVDGLYLVVVNLWWSPSPIGNRQMYLNLYPSGGGGGIIAGRDIMQSTLGTGDAKNSISWQGELVAGDKLEIRVNQTTAGNLSVLSTGPAPNFAVVRIG